MKLRIEIELGNAAFQSESLREWFEVSRILREYCHKIQYQQTLGVVFPSDVHGKGVGTAILINGETA